MEEILMFRKKVSLLLVSFLMLMMAMPVSGAEVTIVESPHVKIIIDGAIGDYTDTPLIVNSRTMLPLREVLVNLGVQNDDEHIIWNGEERSVTVIKDDTTIKLSIGSNTATVNGEEITLDVVPMIYTKNSRTYIPARFVSESLGKKVLWDDSMTAVLITDQSKVDEMTAILDASKAAMADIKSLALNVDIDFNFKSGASDVYLKSDTVGDYDLVNTAAHANNTIDTNYLFGIPLVTTNETYVAEGYRYTSTSLFPGKWTKTATLSSDKAFKYTEIAKDLESNDIMASGLSISNESTDETWILTGGSYVDDIINNLIAMTADYGVQDVTFTINSYELELHIDKSSNHLDYVLLDLAIETTDTSNATSNINTTFKMTVSDIDKDLSIMVPQEVLDAATEITY